MKAYTEADKKYIMSKVTGIRWEAMPESLKQFWINYKNLQP